MPQTVTLVASAARTTSSNSGAIAGFSDVNNARIQLNVSAASGTTPTLDVLVEGTVDGTNWYTLNTFTQKTGATNDVALVQNIVGDQLRVRWTIGGTTPSFTFSVVAVTE